MALYQKRIEWNLLRGDKQAAGHCAHQDDRIIDLYICLRGFVVHAPQFNTDRNCMTMNRKSDMGGAFITAAAHTLTCHKKAVTGLRNFWVSIFPEGLMEYIGTYNIAKQKAAAAQLCRACSSGVESRNCFIRPQEVAMKSRLSDEGRQTGKKLTEQSYDGYRGNDTH